MAGAADTDNEGGVLGWGGAASYLDCSRSHVRRLVKEGQLATSVDDHGLHQFALADLARLRAERQQAGKGPGKRRPRQARVDRVSPAVVPPPSEGEVQAMVFADLEAKKELVQIVIERKVPAARVKELTEQWRELKSLVVDVPGNAPALAQLQEALAQATSKIAELRARGDALLKYLRSLPKLPQSRSRCPTCRSRGSLAVPLTCTVCNTTIQRQAPPAEEQQAPPSGG